MTDIIDELSDANPMYREDALQVSEAEIDRIISIATSEVRGPLRHSRLAAALVGLVIGAAGVGIWTVRPGPNEGADAAATSRPTTTAVATTPSSLEGAADPITAPIQELVPITVRCSSELNDDTLACTNLIDGTADAWNDAGLEGQGAQMVFTFDEPVALAQIHVINVGDATRFRRNYRIRGVEIDVDDLPGLPVPAELPNANDRPHVVSIETTGTTQVTVRVVSTWPAEAIDGTAFDELAVEEIQFWGRRASGS